MANSPRCPVTSPSTSTATNMTDLQETDAFSDDSGVDMKLQKRFLKSPEGTIESGKRNKRKSSEPKKRKDVLLMKRFRWDSDEEDNVDTKDDVFDILDRERPSSGDSGCLMVEPNPSSTVLDMPPEKKKKPRQWRKPKDTNSSSQHQSDDLLSTTVRQSVIRKHDASSISNHSSTTTSTSNAGHCSRMPPQDMQDLLQQDEYSLDGQGELSDASGRSSRGVGRPRNYKNMSRQRRIEANARERTRVHTISAAFENLRRAVPAYAHNQKLSKLAILKIASAYILALACLNNQDYSQEQNSPDLADCVEQCTRTIQAEGRSRRRASKD